MKNHAIKRIANIAAFMTIPLLSFAISFTTSTKNPSCYSLADGSITVSVIGASGTVYYSLKADFSEQQIDNNIFLNLPAGLYDVYVKDDSGVTGPSIVQLVEPDEISITATASPSACSNGEIEIQAQGGTQPYLYSLNNFTGDGQQTNIFRNLTAGNYTIYVKDANGCLKTSATPVVVDDVKMSVGQPSTIQTKCAETADGSAITIVKGGVPSGSGNPYVATLFKDNVAYPVTDILFTDMSGDTRITIGALSKGTYTGTISDQTGCAIPLSFVIGGPAELSSILQNKTEVLCKGLSTGTINIISNGGTKPYTVTCNGGTVVTVENNTNISQLPAGDYQISVTDANSCLDKAGIIKVTINEPIDELTYSPNGNNVDCFGASTGKIFGEAKGGTLPYIYNITNITTPYTAANTIGTFENLPMGNYTATVKDKNNCSVTSTDIIVGEPEEIVIDDITTNPAANVICKGDKTASVRFTLIGRTQIVAPTDTAIYYRVSLFNITEQIEVSSADLKYTNRFHPVLTRIRYEQEPVIDPLTGDPAVDPETGDPITTRVAYKDTLWTDGCHEPTKELEIDDYTVDKKGFDCDDYVTVSSLGEAAYRISFFRGNCQIGNDIEFSVGRTGDVPASVKLNGMTPICDGTTITITPEIVSTPATNSYKWYLDGIQVGTTRLFEHEYIAAENNRVLTLEATNRCGTTVSNAMSVHVWPRPTAVVETKEEFLCEGKSTQVNFEFKGTAPFYYTLPDGQELTTTNAVEKTTVTPMESAEYTLIALRDANCESIIETDVTPTYITIYAKPEYSMTIDVPDPMVNGRAVTVTATPGFIDYKLKVNGIDIPEAETSNVFKPKQFGYGTSNSTFAMTIEDSNGCIWDMEQSEIIESTIFPNVFTPNEDGVNDIFLKDYNIEVFDRWGTLIYAGNDGWNGKHNGVYANPGVYLYTVKINDNTGTETVIKSTVIVER